MANPTRSTSFRDYVAEVERDPEQAASLDHERAMIRYGTRRGQLRFYLRAAWWEARSYGLRRGIRRFWVARWFWSCGRIGVVPNGYSKAYWK